MRFAHRQRSFDAQLTTVENLKINLTNTDVAKRDMGSLVRKGKLTRFGRTKDSYYVDSASGMAPKQSGANLAKIRAPKQTARKTHQKAPNRKTHQKEETPSYIG